jgi:hypothetical protein
LVVPFFHSVWTVANKVYILISRKYLTELSNKKLRCNFGNIHNIM